MNADRFDVRPSGEGHTATAASTGTQEGTSAAQDVQDHAQDAKHAGQDKRRQLLAAAVTSRAWSSMSLNHYCRVDGAVRDGIQIRLA